MRLDVGQSVEVGGYTFTFRGVAPSHGPELPRAGRHDRGARNGALVETLHPEKRVYNAAGRR